MKHIPYYLCFFLFVTTHAQNFDELCKQANAFHYQKKFAQAIDYYSQAIAIDPENAQVYFNKGITHMYINEPMIAIENFKQAIAYNPHYAKAYKFLIELLLKQKETRQALFYAKSYGALDQSEPEILEKIGQAAIAHDELLLAENIYKKLTQLHPENYNTLNTMAYILSRINKNHEAITYYKAALAKNPEGANAHLGLSKALLAIGEFQEGWQEFEWRLARRQDYQKAFGYLRLQPHQLKGKRVLIRAEWGLGDMIQFMRYAQLLKKEGAIVYIQAFDPLINLFKQCDFLDGIIGTSDPIPPIDFHIPLMSLPLICNTTLKNIPAQIPYIFAQPALIDHWHKELKSDAQLKVGICWHAKPIYIEDHLFTRRSIPLEAFIPLALDSVDFYSLQKEFGTDEIEKIASSPLHVHTFNEDFDKTHGRFADTAAVIMNVDVVISADTSIVHVAGALGKPVWVLLPYTAEWRWFPCHPAYEHSSSTPWYPNMRLFKQTEPGNWTTVIEEVKAELKKLVDHKKEGQ